MKLWRRIKKLSLSQLFKLSWVFLKKPLLALPVWRATQNTFVICNRLYGSTHHRSNKANAFRHALWNVLICQKAIKWFKNEQKSIIWTQKVTDLYEKMTQNEILDQAMDLHNNKIGRELFLNVSNKNESEIIDFIAKKAQNACKLEKLEEIENCTNELVYISE